ncbi:MAG: transcription antitermination factor NusB [Acidimicrobiales bacterium]
MTVPSRSRGSASRIRPVTARRVALDALIAVDAGGRANLVVPEALAGSGLDERDRGLVTELVYGTCRMQRACDWLVDRFVQGRTDAQVRAALRMGAYQLGWLRVPSHAAVAATVEEVQGPGRGLVNAVLRKVATAIDGGPIRWPDPATELSYPDWLVARLATDLGPGPARAALVTMNRPAEMTERADGYIQDRASQMVAAHVGSEPGERVIDVCAAPGGKATAMAWGPGGPQPAPGGEGPTGAPGGGPALVVAADSDPSRASLMAGNVERLGLTDSVSVVVADATWPPWPPSTFDRVLVDAPCSGLGVLRRRPDARWRIQPGDIDRLAGLQRRLLTSSAALVRPGGLLVYSVCTLTAAETAGIDRWLASARPDLVPVAPPAAPWTPAGRGALLLPQSEGTDGMFVLALRRGAGSPGP